LIRIIFHTFDWTKIVQHDSFPSGSQDGRTFRIYILLVVIRDIETKFFPGLGQTFLAKDISGLRLRD